MNIVNSLIFFHFRCNIFGSSIVLVYEGQPKRLAISNYGGTNMNIANITRRELVVKALGASVATGILTVLLLACDLPVQPGGGANSGRTETVSIPSILLFPPIEAGESMFPSQIVNMRTETPGTRIYYTN